MSEDRRLPLSACDIDGRPLNPNHPWHPDYKGPPPPRPEELADRALGCLFEYYLAGHELAPVEAALLCEERGRRWPDWLRESMLNMALHFVAGDVPRLRGRGKGTPANRHDGWLIHFARWDAVAEAMERDDLNISPDPTRPPTLDECCAAASELLRGDFAQGSPKAFKDSYQKIQREGPVPLLQRTTDQLRRRRRRRT